MTDSMSPESVCSKLERNQQRNFISTIHWNQVYLKQEISLSTSVSSVHGFGIRELFLDHPILSHSNSVLSKCAGRFPNTQLTNLIFRGSRMFKQAWKRGTPNYSLSLSVKLLHTFHLSLKCMVHQVQLFAATARGERP